MTWWGMPSGPAVKWVRRISWRAMRVVRAWARAAMLRGPVSRTGIGTLYSVDPDASWSRNHSRCWAKDRGGGVVRSVVVMGGAVSPGVAWSMTVASWVMVGWSKRLARGISLSKAPRMREMTWVASRE